jgi:hypothetical protein
MTLPPASAATSLLFVALATAGALRTARAQTCAGAATALRADFRADSPALVVRAAPHFSWVVPAAVGGADATQAAFRLVVSPLVGAGGAPAWDSGRVASAASVAVPFGGAANLTAGAAYSWSVTVWLAGGAAACPPSEAAVFVVALGAGGGASGGGWAPGAAWIVAATPAAQNQASFVRKEVSAPAAAADVALAVLHATALTDPALLGFRAYVGGALVGVGPGRGEARVWGGDGAFRGLPYVSIDVTAAVRASAGAQSALVLAAAAFGSVRSNSSRGVMLQVDVHYADGSVSSVATDATWDALDADAFLGMTPDTSGQTAYAHSLEFTDARLEPIGWREPGFAGGPGWAPAAVVQRAADPGPTAGLTPTMAAPLELLPARSPTRVEALSATLGFADFGREFQGGLILSVAATGSSDSGGGGSESLAGARVTLIAGEAVLDNHSVAFTWGYNFTFTLRNGSQTIEQLQFMEFRYVNVVLEPGSPLSLSDVALTAWGVRARWVAAETAFNSSDAMLNDVWELCRYTLEAGVLETYTDSNTRERRPYEADGLIAATARGWLQSDVLWARHSHSYVLQNPTWPIEWRQMTAWLAHADYMATGSADLTAAFLPTLLANTHYPADLDATGLLNATRGRHIVDWYPGPTRAMFASSEHLSVNQFFALGGLRKLAALAAAAGSPERAAQAGAWAEALQANVTARMALGNGDLCDGACADPAVANHSGVTTAAWGLFTGATPSDGVPAAFARLAAWGQENFGDYGQFVYLSALNAAPDGDDGAATLRALTKCDAESWCNQITVQNCTMTRETPILIGTFSHAWGTAAIAGAAGGLLGISQTAPTWSNFTVAPRLGGLRFASLTVPTLRGPLVVDANATHTAVAVPCGTKARICARKNGGASAAPGTAPATLLLDGRPVASVSETGLHLCVDSVGCGASGAARVVTVAGVSHRAMAA